MNVFLIHHLKNGGVALHLQKKLNTFCIGTILDYGGGRELSHVQGHCMPTSRQHWYENEYLQRLTF
jgi:hypothetical protein